MYKLFLTLRYLRKRRIAYFAIAAVMLCTAMVLIVMSVMGGFLDQLKFKARGLLGDIIIDNRSYSGFPLYEEFIADVSEWPEVEKATPVLYSWGLLHFKDTAQTHTVRVVGLRLEDVYEVNEFRQGLYYERYYPGTTHLGEQPQPLLNIDLDAPPIELRNEEGQLFHAVRPVLPPAYQDALEQSWADGVRDDESPETELTRICREAGLPEIVGEYQTALGSDVYTPDGADELWPGLIIGRDIIAKRLSDGKYQRYWLYPRGCLVTVTLLPVSESGAVDTPIKPPFRYVDDSRTGIFEIDSQHVYCNFDLLQKLLLMQAAERVDPETGATVGIIPARCSQIQMKIRRAVDGQRVVAREVAQRLQEHYRGFLDDPRFDLTPGDEQLIEAVEAMTWEESQAHIIAPVEKERQLVTILFGIISLVAAVLVLCILYMIVLQKTRDIGIIKSLGGSSSGVALIFIMYGAAVGIVGSVTGTFVGYWFVVKINDIQEYLVWAFGWRVWDRSVYSFDEIPNTVRTFDMALVVAFAIVVSTLGSLLAAWRAGSMQPIQALSYE
ncbi:MAG: ABC transporter permease [Phycisphaerae bacterium]|nr:ABC transporter permease [Phycisphaerae bacterium]